MADNFSTDPGSGGATFGSEEMTVNGALVHVPYVLLHSPKSGSAIVSVVQGGPWKTTATGGVSVTQGGAFKVTSTGVAQVTQGGPFKVTSTGVAQVTQGGAFKVTATGNVTIANTVDVTKNGAWDVSISGTAAVDVMNIPSVAPDSSRLYDGRTSLTPKFAAVGESTASSATVIAGVTNKKIRVISCAIVGGATNIYFENSIGQDQYLFGKSAAPVVLVNGSGFVLPYNPVGWFETSADDALAIHSTVATSIAGSITYVEV